MPTNAKLPHEFATRSAASRLWLPALLVLAMVALVIAIAWPSQPKEPLSRQVTSGLPVNVSVDPKFDEQVPLDLVFRDEQGKEVRLGELLDRKPVILNLIYFRCPMLCNMVSDGLNRALRAMDFTAGDQFTILSISFDPHEGPQLAAAAKQTALDRYGRDGAAKGWHFLTGDERSIRKLTDTVGFGFEYDNERGQYAHAAGLFVLTPSGKVARFFGGIQFSARDLRLGLVEASANQIATTSDHVLLLCYQYDPATGKYGFVIMNVVRLAGGLTVLAMMLGFFFMLRRQKRDTPIRGIGDASDVSITAPTTAD